MSLGSFLFKMFLSSPLHSFPPSPVMKTMLNESQLAPRKGDWEMRTKVLPNRLLSVQGTVRPLHRERERIPINLGKPRQATRSWERAQKWHVCVHCWGGLVSFFAPLPPPPNPFSTFGDRQTDRQTSHRAVQVLLKYSSTIRTPPKITTKTGEGPLLYYTDRVKI